MDDIKMERGLFSIQDLNNHEIIAQIPLELLFTKTKAIESLLRIFDLDDIGNLPEIDVFALGFLVEKNKLNSEWKAYFNCLPKEVNTPINFSDFDLEIFKDLQIYQFIKRRNDSILVSFEEVTKVISNDAYLANKLKLSLNDWKYGLSIIWSRKFEIKMDGKRIDKVLVPFGDFINFNTTLNDDDLDSDISMNYNVKSYTSKNNKEFIFKMVNDVDKNTQIFGEYSVDIQPNYILYINYGICMLYNPMDELFIYWYDLLGSNTLKDIQKGTQNTMKKLLNELYLNDVIVPLILDDEYNGIESYTFSLYLLSLMLESKDDIILFSDELLDASNFENLNTNQDIFKEILKIVKESFLIESEYKTLIDNAYKNLYNWATKALNEYYTSIIQDLMILDSREYVNKFYCVIALRISEKLIRLQILSQIKLLQLLLR